MSFKRNVLASYASQIYVTLIGIVIVPVYIQFMGAEAYGLIGFYAMLQAWFLLLDMGLAPTMSRETARFAGGAMDALQLRQLLRALEGVFYAVGLLGALALMVGADAIAARWLKVEHLPLDQVRLAIELMAAIIGLRWVAGLYRGAIGGFEQQVWLGQLNAAMATARFVLVLPVFYLWGTTPAHFFGYQLAVAGVETAVLAVKTYRLMPALPSSVSGSRVGWSWAPLRGVLKFSLSIAFTSAVWVFVTQTDKLVLSKLLPLGEYAYFTLAVLVAGGVSIVSGPISTALLPRLSRLQAQHDEQGLIDLYRKATQWVAVIALPVALMLACFAEPLLWAWTGNATTAAHAAPILSLYALGNGILALGAFPYYLQFAKGDVRLHLLGNVLFVVVLIPTVIWATLNFGATGAGWAWLGANAAYFLFWVPLVHRRFAPGLHGRWLFQDVGPVALVTAVAALSAMAFLSPPASRLGLVALLLLIGMAVMALAALSSAPCRGFIRQKWLARTL
ncbi:oligosaccharide flippase family protein [Leptothrix ochracea]|uniref:oligosaccharide flippase family protein n=2 Tax=Leptothrix ochracea TaxID=735331 RepID=UPI0034E2DB45